MSEHKMSKSYVKKKYTGKRKYTKSQNATTNTVVSRGPVAPRTIVRLKYNENYLTPGTTIDHVWNINSIFDPNRTGTGHQPLGYDQYAAFYNRYRVYRCDYIINIAALLSAENYKVSVGATNSASTITTANLAAEQPTFVSKSFSNASPTTLKGSWYLPNVNGQTATQYKADDRFQAIFNADPAEVILMHIVVSSIGSGAAPAANAVGIDVTLIYHVEMFDHIQLGQS